MLVGAALRKEDKNTRKHYFSFVFFSICFGAFGRSVTKSIFEGVLFVLAESSPYCGFVSLVRRSSKAGKFVFIGFFGWYYVGGVCFLVVLFIVFTRLDLWSFSRT